MRDRAWRTAVDSLARADLASQQHVYPFGYPLLAAPFIRRMPPHPWLVPNLLLACLSLILLFTIYTRFMTALEATALLSATYVLARWQDSRAVPTRGRPLPGAAARAMALRWPDLRERLRVVVAGLLAGIPFVAMVFLGNVLVFGTVRSPYMEVVANVGFNWSYVPLKLHALLAAPDHSTSSEPR